MILPSFSSIMPYKLDSSQISPTTITFNFLHVTKLILENDSKVKKKKIKLSGRNLDNARVGKKQ